MNFMEYVLINESELEDLMVSDDPTENIELIHEMEYKLRKIVDNQYSLNPKMYVNIIKRFSNFTFEAYDDLSERFDRLFEHWLEHHNIENIEEWADSVFNENEDLIADEGIVAMGGVHINQDELIGGLSDESFAELLHYNYGDDILENFNNYAGSFLQSKEHPAPEGTEEYEADNYWEDNDSEAVDVIEENDWEDEFTNYIIEILRDIGDYSWLTIDDNTWRNGIETVLYPLYYAQHGYNIENVTPDVEEIRDRLSNAYEGARKGEMIINALHPDDADLDKNIESLMDIIGKLTSAISLSMNVMHTSGNIMTDYGDVAGLEDVDEDFLSGFNDRNIDDWTAELKRIIRR